MSSATTSAPQADNEETMIKPKEFEIIFGNPRKVYKPGDTLTGSLVLHIEQQQNYSGLRLELTGKARVDFSKDAGGKRKKQHTAFETYFNKEVRIMPLEGLGAGHHEFPFTYTLPAGIPSSFECRAGSVRYAVEATLGMGHHRSACVRRYFVVYSPVDLNDFTSAGDPVENEEEVILCCGPITTRISLPREGFAPGETITAKAEVSNNSSSDIRKMFFTIEQTSLCLAAGVTECASGTLKGRSPPVEHAGVAAGSSVTWNAGDIVVTPVTVPTGLHGCQIIDVKHRLVLNCVMGAFVSSASQVAGINIMIGTEPIVSDEFSASNIIPTRPSASHLNQGYSHSLESLPQRSPVHSSNNWSSGNQPPSLSGNQQSLFSADQPPEISRVLPPPFSADQLPVMASDQSQPFSDGPSPSFTGNQSSSGQPPPFSDDPPPPFSRNLPSPGQPPPFSDNSPPPFSGNLPSPGQPPPFSDNPPPPFSGNLPSPGQPPPLSDDPPPPFSRNLPSPSQPPAFSDDPPPPFSGNLPSPSQPPAFSDDPPPPFSGNLPTPSQPPAFSDDPPPPFSGNLPSPSQPPAFSDDPPPPFSGNLPPPSQPPPFSGNPLRQLSGNRGIMGIPPPVYCSSPVIQGISTSPAEQETPM